MTRGALGKVVIIGEWKGTYVPFDTSDHPSKIYNPTEALKKQKDASRDGIPQDNTTATLVQIFSYLYSKGGAKKGHVRLETSSCSPEN